MSNTSKVEQGAVEPLLVSRNQAARLLGLSARSIDLLLKASRQPTTKIGKRILIPSAAVHELAENGSEQRIRPASTKPAN